MPTVETLPGPCGLCGETGGTRLGVDLACAACGWRYGDAPDYDLAPPRVDIVYYVRARDRVKIGTTCHPRQRLAALRFDELLAFERGDRLVEHARHVEFAKYRVGGEWFELRGELAAHVARLGLEEPWIRYARWVAEALSARDLPLGAAMVAECRD